MDFSVAFRLAGRLLLLCRKKKMARASRHFHADRSFSFGNLFLTHFFHFSRRKIETALLFAHSEQIRSPFCQLHQARASDGFTFIHLFFAPRGVPRLRKMFSIQHHYYLLVTQSDWRPQNRTLTRQNHVIVLDQLMFHTLNSIFIQSNLAVFGEHLFGD